jgi:branched-chain amino acid transport system permease protein
MIEFFNTYGFLIVSMLIAAMMATSLYLPLMAGQLSLASPGFYALGGYTAALLAKNVWPPANGELLPIWFMFLEMLIAGAFAGVIAIFVGISSLRLRGIYLALATIAFVEILRVLSLNLEITGGAVGIFGIPQVFSGQGTYLLVALPMLLLTALFTFQLERSRVGRALTAIREDELAAAAMGVNITFYKILAFTIGAILAGMVGALNAHILGTWNARQGTFDASILYLAFVIIGGSRNFVGPIMGGLLLTALPEALRAVAGIDGLPRWFSQFLVDGRLIIYGVLIAVGSVFFPQGIITPDLFKRRKPKNKTASPVDVVTEPKT